MEALRGEMVFNVTNFRHFGSILGMHQSLYFPSFVPGFVGVSFSSPVRDAVSNGVGLVSGDCCGGFRTLGLRQSLILSSSSSLSLLRNFPYDTFIVAGSDRNYGLLSPYLSRPALLVLRPKNYHLQKLPVQSGIVPSGRTQTVDALKMSDLC
ncbi:hypothetical protein OUZ56_031993 [Daphnia magna]|uniref:Uncharacterized protein n=1 Tax=Daphnia magna TaxID=35525 RepID=A0ABQ9ZVW5_9CRUS|nr:hypothetical protein OUZ56_031993 [Daphnia magna]